MCDDMSLSDATLHYESLPLSCAEMMFREQKISARKHQGYC